MEIPLTKLIITVVSLAIAASTIGLVWSIYSGLSQTADVEVTNLQVFKSGSYWRVTFKVKNIGTMKVDWIGVYLWRGTSNIASWSTSQDVPVNSEVFIDSGWVRDPDPQYGEALKCEVRVRFYGGREIRKYFDVIVLQW